MVEIRSRSIVGERNDDAISGRIAYFEGAALKIQLLHPAIHYLYLAVYSSSIPPALVSVLEVFLNTDEVGVGVAASILPEFHGNDVSRLELADRIFLTTIDHTRVGRITDHSTAALIRS